MNKLLSKVDNNVALNVLPIVDEAENITQRTFQHFSAPDDYYRCILFEIYFNVNKSFGSCSISCSVFLV